MLGGIIAIDMGGFPAGRRTGSGSESWPPMQDILVAATLGCTVTFTIPVGMGMVPEEDRPLFARGILAGLMMLPVSLFIGGLLTGLTPLNTIRQSLAGVPGLLCPGLWYFQMAGTAGSVAFCILRMLYAFCLRLA